MTTLPNNTGKSVQNVVGRSTERSPCWDGKTTMEWREDDGGRAGAEYKGYAGDCVCRALAIVTGLPYNDVYEALAEGTGTQRAGKRGKRPRSAREGINTSRKWFKDWMAAHGFVWTPTMHIGQGCKVHLCEEELPMGRLVVAVSKHYTAVIDRVIHDTYDPQRNGIATENGQQRIIRRCVYGYWHIPAKETT